MLQLKYIIRILVSLIAQPRETWNYLANAETDEAKPEYMFHNFYYPLFGFACLFILICQGFHGAGEDETFSLQVGMTRLVPVLVAYFVSPYISQSLIKLTCSSFFHYPNVDKERLQLFVFYCTGYLMALEMLLALVPSIQFFKFLSVYLFFITWCASSNYIKVDLKYQWTFGVLSFLILIFVPTIVVRILQVIQG